MSDPSSNITMYESESELRRGPWTLEEDNLLIQYISCHGEGRWNSLAKFAGLKRTGKSCRLRWLNYLKPDIKRGNLTPHEQLLILELHCKWGNRWSKIAQHLPGRTDNEIKNYWRTRVQKQARQLKVDSNSKNFLEAIRTFWIPRLVEQMEQNTPSSSTPDFQKPSSNQQVNKNNNNNNSVDSDPQVSNSGSHFPSAGKIPSSSEISIEDSCNYNVGFSFPSCYDDMQDAGVSQCHVAGMDWFGEELGSTFWNSDELWQFRKWEDVDDML